MKRLCCDDWLLQGVSQVLRAGCRSRQRMARKVKPVLRDLNILLTDVRLLRRGPGLRVMPVCSAVLWLAGN